MIINLLLCGGKILALKSPGQWDFLSIKLEFICGYWADDASAGPPAPGLATLLE
jgi:hypothetical protein